VRSSRPTVLRQASERGHAPTLQLLGCSTSSPKRRSSPHERRSGSFEFLSRRRTRRWRSWRLRESCILVVSSGQQRPISPPRYSISSPRQNAVSPARSSTRVRRHRTVLCLAVPNGEQSKLIRSIGWHFGVSTSDPAVPTAHSSQRSPASPMTSSWVRRSICGQLSVATARFDREEGGLDDKQRNGIQVDRDVGSRG
jgi:hypothetical protein